VLRHDTTDNNDNNNIQNICSTSVTVII